MYYSRPQMGVEQVVQEPLHEPDREHVLPERGCGLEDELVYDSHEDVCVVGGVGLTHGPVTSTVARITLSGRFSIF